MNIVSVFRLNHTMTSTNLPRQTKQHNKTGIIQTAKHYQVHLLEGVGAVRLPRGEGGGGVEVAHLQGEVQEGAELVDLQL